MVQQPGRLPTTSDRTHTTTRLAHLSDVHFGKISHPGIVEALVSEVNAAAMNLVVVSGDLTQRAHDWQFAEAKAMLDAFVAPVLVVPGNHDVRQFWHNPLERVLSPAARFENHITNDLTPTFSTEGVSVFGMNTAHGLTVKGGLIRAPSLEKMLNYFAARPAEDFRVLVLHHHLIKNEAAFGRTDIAIGSAKALQAVEECGVRLILCGHYHVSNTSEYPLGGEHRVVVATAGTATSSRGRGDHKAVNAYNWITIAPDHFVVEERRFEAEAGGFLPNNSMTFGR